MLLTSREVAVMFGISPGTVRRWAYRGWIPVEVQTAGGHYRYDAATIRRLRDASVSHRTTARKVTN